MPDLNFDNQNTLYATHGLHAYAAKCPPQLARYGLRYYSRPGEMVLDPMAGSGTTAVACLRHGRRFAGFEINPEYVQVACARVAAAAQAMPAIEPDGAPSLATPTLAAANDDVSPASRPHLIP